MSKLHPPLAAFLEKVVLLRVLVPFSVTSWIRTPKRNQAIGGHPRSWHLMGLAVDVVLDNPEDTDRLVEAARRFGLDVVVEEDHVHLEVKL